MSESSKPSDVPRREVRAAVSPARVLELPRAPGFAARRAPVSLAAAVSLREARLGDVNRRPGAERERLASKSTRRFEL